MNVHHLDDSQEIARNYQQHNQILELKARRQTAGHPTYGAVAASITITSSIVWGGIVGDAWIGTPEPVTRSALVAIAGAIVLGIAAIATCTTWMIVRVMQRQAGELDTLNDYQAEQRDKRDEQRANRIVNATIARLNEEDRRNYIKAVTDEFKAETASVLNGGMKDTTVTPFSRSRPGQRSS